jgi:hypothetical protein
MEGNKKTSIRTFDLLFIMFFVKSAKGFLFRQGEILSNNQRVFPRAVRDK